MVHDLVRGQHAVRAAVAAERAVARQADDGVALGLEPRHLAVGRGPVPEVVGIVVVEDVGYIVHEVAAPLVGQLDGQPDARRSGGRRSVRVPSHGVLGLRGWPVQCLRGRVRCWGVPGASAVRGVVGRGVRESGWATGGSRPRPRGGASYGCPLVVRYRGTVKAGGRRFGRIGDGRVVGAGAMSSQGRPERAGRGLVRWGRLCGPFVLAGEVSLRKRRASRRLAKVAERTHWRCPSAAGLPSGWWGFVFG